MERRFIDRENAGQILAQKLKPYANHPDTVVLALPRGGIKVAFGVAQTLKLPLDIFMVRKLGVPNQPELAMGAIASGGMRVLNQDILSHLNISNEYIETEAQRQNKELRRQENYYRNGRPALALRNKTVILIDDGLATGASMRAAISALRQQHPKRIIVAVPVASVASCAELKKEVEEIICEKTPEPFFSVGMWYDDFSQTSDGDVRDLLQCAQEWGKGSPGQ